MATALRPRFVLEAGFLVLLAVVVGLADLDSWLIILVMLVGWILVSLIEYFAWRQSHAASFRRFQPAVVTEDAVVEDAPPPPPPPPPPPAPAPPAEEETVVAPPAAEEETEPEAGGEPAPAKAEGPTAFSMTEERRVAHRLEPLQPRPRRRWILFGPYARREKAAEDDSEA